MPFTHLLTMDGYTNAMHRIPRNENPTHVLIMSDWDRLVGTMISAGRNAYLGIVLHMGPSSSGREASVYHEKFLDEGLHVQSNNKIDKHLSVPVSTVGRVAYNLQTSNPSEYQECDPH